MNRFKRIATRGWLGNFLSVVTFGYYPFRTDIPIVHLTTAPHVLNLTAMAHNLSLTTNVHDMALTVNAHELSLTTNAHVLHLTGGN